MSGTVIKGACHCGNVSFELVTDQAPAAIRARACDCTFCRIHASLNWSDPDGTVTVRVANEQRLNRYRFGLGTADFYICRECGAYVGAVLTDGDQSWSTLNLRLAGREVSEEPASYGAENEAERVARRKRAWTPTRVIIEA